MNLKSEEKLLREFSKILDAPGQADKRFMRYAKIAMFLSALFVFFLLSDNIDLTENKFYFTLLAFISGTAFGLSLWFFQAGTQTSVMARHMSRDSVDERLAEIERDTTGS